MERLPRLGAQRRALSFWPLQIGGWTLYGVATALTYIPFRHMREAVDYQIAFLCSTFLASFLLYAFVISSGAGLPR